MITDFKNNYYYKWIGPTQPLSGWDWSSEMNFILDGKWHKCNKIDIYNSNNASFYDCCMPEKYWHWGFCIEYFIEKKYINETLIPSEKILKKWK